MYPTVINGAGQRRQAASSETAHDGTVEKNKEKGRKKKKKNKEKKIKKIKKRKTVQVRCCECIVSTKCNSADDGEHDTTRPTSETAPRPCSPKKNKCRIFQRRNTTGSKQKIIRLQS